MKKPALLILFLLLAAITVIGENLVTGEITLRIINRPPVITNVTLSMGKSLTCGTTVSDEGKTTLHYKWFRDGVPTDHPGEKFSAFREGETIRCEAIAEDNEHLYSEPVSAEIYIQKMPVEEKIFGPLLRGITGLSVKEQGTNTNNAFNLVLMLLIFGLILSGIRISGKYRTRA